MYDFIRKKLLSTLEEAIALLKKNNAYKLQQLSNELINYTAIYQDAYSVSTSVMLYSLAKVINHGLVRSAEAVPKIEAAYACLSSNDELCYEKRIQVILRLIKQRDNRSRAYLRTVIELTQIKKSCLICANGISIGRAAEILKISRWELMKQMGLTRINDMKENKTRLDKRLDFARRLFS